MYAEQCSILHKYSHSYPLGKVKVKGIHILSKNISLNECISLCCHEGPSKCHYVWFFDQRCVGLPCLTNKTACSPQTMEGLPSTLVSIKYKSDEKGDGTTPGVLLYDIS